MRSTQDKTDRTNGGVKLSALLRLRVAGALLGDIFLHPRESSRIIIDPANSSIRIERGDNDSEPENT